MIALTLGIVIGVALGLLVMAFIAIGSYDRGYDAATRRRVSSAHRSGQPVPSLSHS